ncbi:hypothetical protein FH972_021625 [Carpinus fangiana]|uniref:Electron transfer flavoprotein alpha/beta-subunit N-terminal domain-containing protein n=1 Tax=Carpinus fangiana TaxID=176857 RepID=A0A5N6KQG6_9ROSI|nr:hypothetical protein FH972_021625 [Carpinus fangiana]
MPGLENWGGEKYVPASASPSEAPQTDPAAPAAGAEWDRAAECAPSLATSSSAGREVTWSPSPHPRWAGSAPLPSPAEVSYDSLLLLSLPARTLSRWPAARKRHIQALDASRAPFGPARCLSPPAPAIAIRRSRFFCSPPMFNAARTSTLRQARSCLRQAGPIAPAQQAAFLRRLLSSLAVLEQRDGKLNPASLSAISAAQKLGGSVTGFVAGKNIKAVADEIAKIKGLEKVVFVDNEAYEKMLPENFATLLVENIKKGEYTHVLSGNSATCKSIMPRVAALLDVSQISDITGIESEDSTRLAFVRPMYAGNVILTVQSTDSIKVVTVRGSSFPNGETEGGSAATEEGIDSKTAPTSEWVSERMEKSERPELASADTVVSGGRALKSKEEFDRLILPLADAFGAAVGASRAAVDSGFADNSLQVGQTGKNVVPQLYLCAGISGAIQHLAGMKDSKVIAAINKDPDAPIFQVADVGLVADLFQAVPELTEKKNALPNATHQLPVCIWKLAHAFDTCLHGNVALAIEPHAMKPTSAAVPSTLVGSEDGRHQDMSRRKQWLKTFDAELQEEYVVLSTNYPRRMLKQVQRLVVRIDCHSVGFPLLTSWRMDLNIGPDGTRVPELMGQPFKDPPWCLDVNIGSLACGFLGNLFLLANFTSRIRYIIALPVTIILWYMSTGMLIGITVGMNMYAAPDRPEQTYTQGFWYAVLAAIMYLVCSMILMINMLGYFLGHYPQHFSLTDAQRTLILQTMMFFIWLAGGAGIFSAVGTTHGEPGWKFADALYFCDVTILTVGFGGLVFPYSVGGIIMLGLVISSISRFVGEISKDKIMKKRAENKRAKTVERSQPKELAQAPPLGEPGHARPYISAPIDLRRRSSAMEQAPELKSQKRVGARGLSFPGQRRRERRARNLILHEEKDRFEAMRRIQDSMKSFQQWTALASSIIVFSVLWCAGAAVFFVTESSTQGLSYFQALYFCYVSLLTIGYGDLAPKSNAGRPFFVMWSLLAVPTMTILVSTLGDTVINRFKSATSKLADFTILPKYGIWADILRKFQARAERKAAERRLETGFEAGPSGADFDQEQQHHVPTLDELARAKSRRDESHLARELAAAIRRTANDLKDGDSKRYSYEEWVELTELIRFTTGGSGAGDDGDEEEEALIEWDWIGEDSPMMVDKSEPEFVLDRLCESMSRFIRNRVRSSHEKPADVAGKAAEED